MNCENQSNFAFNYFRSYFHFVGRIIGTAVFHGHHIDGGFTTPFYKMLLNKPITLDDIEANDPDLHKSLNWMLNNNIQDIIDTSFSVEHEAFGVIRVHELKPGGKNIPVRFFLKLLPHLYTTIALYLLSLKRIFVLKLI